MSQSGLFNTAQNEPICYTPSGALMLFCKFALQQGYAKSLETGFLETGNFTFSMFQDDDLSDCGKKAALVMTRF